MGCPPLSGLGSWSIRFWKWLLKAHRGRKSSRNTTVRLAGLQLRRRSDLQVAHSLQKMPCDAPVDYSRRKYHRQPEGTVAKVANPFQADWKRNWTPGHEGSGRNHSFTS